MEVRFATVELEKRYRSNADARKAWGEKIARRYVQRVDALYEAQTLKDLAALRSLRLHPLKGTRRGQRAINLDGAWRLIVRFEGERLTIVRVEEVAGTAATDTPSTIRAIAATGFSWAHPLVGKKPAQCSGRNEVRSNMASERVWPDIAIPPGETLAEELEARGLSQSELARRMGRPFQTVNEIVRGKKAITAATALDLEDVLGVSALFWLRLEAAYQLNRARLARRSPRARRTAVNV